MNPDEWDLLPWWAQHLYKEGLHTERPWVVLPQLKREHDPFGRESEVFSIGPGDGIAGDEPESIEDLASLGINAQYTGGSA